MAARPVEFIPQINCFEQGCAPITHASVGELPKPAHRDHHILDGGEIFHQEMELKDEADQLRSPPCELLVTKTRDRSRPDRNCPGVRFIKQTEDVKQSTFSTARWPDHGVDAAELEVEGDTAQSMHARFIFAEITFNVPATERKLAFHTFKDSNRAECQPGGVEPLAAPAHSWQ